MAGSFTLIGTCKQCGAPITAPTVWMGINPPDLKCKCGCKKIQPITEDDALSN